MSPLRDRFPWQALDVVMAVLLAADFCVESLFAVAPSSPGRVVTLVAAAPFAASVALRRRWPFYALPLAMTVALIQQLFHGQLFTTLPSESAEYIPILCSYMIGARVETRRGSVSIAVSALLLYALAAVASAQHSPGAPGWVGGFGLSFFFIIPAWVVGCVMRERGRRALAFAELERGALAERAQRERAAIAEERALIGRELQDIIAHSVSVMVVQAGGARRSLLERPDRARESILAVEQTGRETLAEMRRLLGVLRRDDDPRALAPQPGLAQLDELLEQLRLRGLECRVAGEAAVALTPGVDLVAYRVIEAALSRVAEHGGRSARVTVGGGARMLELEITGEGAGHVTDLGPVAERVMLYDGRLEVLGDDRQLVVRCLLPLGALVAA